MDLSWRRTTTAAVSIMMAAMAEISINALMGCSRQPAAALAWIGRQGATSLGLGAVTALLFLARRPPRAPRLALAGSSAGSRQSRSHGRGGRRAVPELTMALYRDGAVSHLPAAYLLTPVLTRFKE